MKILNILTITILAISLHAQSTWTALASPSNTQLNGLYFSDPQTGYVVDANGAVWVTSDGGTNWSAGSFTASAGFYAIGAYDNAAIAVGDRGEIAASNTAASTTWSEQLTPGSAYLLGVYFSNATQGWAVGGCGTYINTNDGGSNWVLTDLGSFENFNDILFSGNTGIIPTSNSAILRSIDGGSSWSNIALTNAGSLRQIAQQGTNFYVVSPSTGLYQSSDNGVSWSNVTSLPTGNYNSVATSDNQIVVGGTDGTSYLSQDNGTTWTAITGATATIRDIHCLADGTCFAVGVGGNIWKMESSCSGFMAEIAEPDSITCASSSVILTASATLGDNLSYNWADSGGNASGTNSTLFVTDADTYIVIITNEDNGCTAESMVEVVEDTAFPTINIATPDILSCDVTSTTLDGSATTGGTNLAYEWYDNDSNLIEANAVVEVNTAGTYWLAVSNLDTGCSATSSVTVPQDQILPNAAASVASGIGVLTCDNLQVTLQGSSSDNNASFVWTGPNGFSDNTANPIVNDPGTYSFVVTGENGCTNMSTVEIAQDIELPIADAGTDPILTCAETEVSLDGSASSVGGIYTYEWTTTGGNIVNGETTLTPSVDQGGTYNLVVTNEGNGCTATSSVQVVPDENIPNAVANMNGVLTCDNLEVLLDNTGSSTGGNIEYEWTGSQGNMLGSMSTTTVTDFGVYNLLVTDTDNGCTNMASIQVEQDVIPPIADAGTSQTLSNNTAILDGSASISNESCGLNYEWQDGTGNVLGTAETISISQADFYTLIVTDICNGCVDSNTVAISTEEISSPFEPCINPILDNCPCNPEGADICESAPLLSMCQLDGWVGQTAPEFYTDESMDPNSGINDVGWCGGGFSIENNQWIAFIAETTTFSMFGQIQTCSSNSGIQIGIYEPSPIPTQCVGTQVFCQAGQSGGNTISFFNIQNLVIGDLYYLMFDGFGGDNCPFTIEIQGFEDPVEAVPISNFPVCSGQPNAAALSGILSTFTPTMTYLWETTDGNIISGEDTMFPVIDEPGTYTLTVYDTQTCCIHTAEVEVPEVVTFPEAVADVDGIITCDETATISPAGSTGLPGGAGYIYQWFGPDSENVAFHQGPELEVEVTEPGEYFLTIVDLNSGCLALEFASVVVPIDTVSPMAEPMVNGIIGCANAEINLLGNGPNFTGYAWEGPDGFMSTDADPLVDAGGEYSVTITSPDNGCTTSAIVEVPEDFEEPGVMATGGTIDCENLNINIEATSMTADVVFDWTGATFSDTGGSVSVAAADTYTVVATGANGCTSTATALVDDVIDLPTVIADVTGTLNCTTTEIMLDGGSNAANATYEWTDPNGMGITGEDPMVSDAGTYTLIVTNLDNSCTETATITVEEDIALPDATVTTDDILDCITLQVPLQGSSTASSPSFDWTGPNSFSDNTATPAASDPGTYTLTVTGANGCTATTTVELTQDVDEPTANAGTDGLITCTQTITALDGTGSSTGDVSYEWTNPSGSVESTTIDPTISSAGTYILLVTDNTNGCTATDDVLIDTDADIPMANAGMTQALDCNVTEVILNGSASSQDANLTYSWTNSAGIEVGIDLNTLTSTADTYTLTVNNPDNGCSAQANVEITQNITDPTPQIETPNTLSCTILSIDVDASNSVGNQLTYQWQDANGMALGTNPSQAITEAGDYILIVTDNENGCTAQASTTVPADEVLPTVMLDANDILTCVTTDLEISSMGSSTGTDFEYQWSDPNDNTLNTDVTTTVSEPGIYMLEITNTTNGCVETNTIEVLQDIAAPIADAGDNGLLTCAISSVTLDGSASMATDPISYTWSDGSTSATTNITQAGDYILTVTNTVNGCTAADVLTISEDTTPPNITTQNTNLDCDGTAILEGSSPDNVSYEWFDSNGISLGTQQDLMVSTAGNYDLVVTSTTNGCSSTSLLNVAEAPLVTPSITGESSFCEDMSSTLSLSQNYNTYLWSTGANTPSITINQGDTYTVTVTDTQGCTGTTTFDIVSIPLPVINIQGATSLSCDEPTTTLSQTGTMGDYEWQGQDGSILSTNNQIEIQDAGTYTFTVSNNGCTNSTTININDNNLLPQASINSSVELDCTSGNLILQMNESTSPDFTYLWTTSDGTISGDNTSNNLSIIHAGTYQVLVTDTTNGCENTASITIPDFTAAITSSDGSMNELVYCEGDDLALVANLPPLSGVFGAWEANPTSVVIANPNDLIPMVSNLQEGQNQLVWTLYTDDCGAVSMDTLNILYEGAIPNAIDDAFVFDNDSEVAVNVLENDQLENISNWQMNILEGPNTGDFDYNEFSGDLSYTPDAGFTGEAIFLYELCNANCANCSQAEVSLRFRALFDDTKGVPLIVTPNSDGLNDYLHIEEVNNYPGNEVFVFNRWGSLIWYGKNYNNQDVKFEGMNLNGKEVPEGTYYFEAKLDIGEGEYFFGSVTIKRE